MTAELPLERTWKYPDEKFLVGFNFRRDVAKGISVASIVSIVPVATHLVGGTADGDIVISGLSSPAGSTRVQAFASGGLAGEIYILKCKANMSDGQAPLEIHIELYILQR